ncbi:MAG TPA: sensor histidine kinase [Candidatus Mediterraneibacter stercoripullorum]|nr:sensor histidine kinase [Candidatus Mediterraneibacter stercoripullorum]
MKFLEYPEERIYDIIYYILFLFLIIFILAASGTKGFYIFLFSAVSTGAFLLFLFFSFRRTEKESERIISLADSLEETYYISEVLPRPKNLQDRAMYYALRKACRAMNNRLAAQEQSHQEYQEYIETFAHEIKIPISALSLAFDNENNFTLKKETDRISRLVEQMLYYARSENPENDYFIRKTSLDEVVHSVILKYRHYLIEQSVKLNIDINNVIVYTDIKWLTFILSQIVQNSIKYFDKPEKVLSVRAMIRSSSVTLIIEDNGCGIPSADLPRIFEKGFTGSNRSRATATGMGLYLARKLALRLGLHLTAESAEGEYARILVSFPKGTVHRFDDTNL